jgi:hypothetical protein
VNALVHRVDRRAGDTPPAYRAQCARCGWASRAVAEPELAGVLAEAHEEDCLVVTLERLWAAAQ